MKLSTKIFLAIFIISITATSSFAYAYYGVIKQHYLDNYNRQYNSLGLLISNSFIEMDKLSETISLNAVTTLQYIQRYEKIIPNDKDLRVLAKRLGVQGLYIVNKDGRFIRSSDLPVEQQKNSLFSYCNAYKDLITGQSNLQATPIIPSYPYNVPAKIIMIPSYNKELILEASYHLKYIEEILLKTMRENKNIVSIGLYSPNNFELGYITSNGKFELGKANVTIPAVLASEKLFSYHIKANTSYCCECTVKKTQFLGGDYYYRLDIKLYISAYSC